MTPDKDLERLQIASSLITFNRNLKRAGWHSLGWGLFNLVIIGVSLARYGSFTPVLAIIALLGTVLIAEGIYVRFVQKPPAVLAEAATLGLLAALNLVGFALAIAGKTHFLGHPIVGVAQAFSAYSTWAVYGTYKHLFSNADQPTRDYVQSCLDNLRSADIRTDFSVVEFTIAPFLGETNIWRIKCYGELILFVRSSDKHFGLQNYALEAFWLPKTMVRLERRGETWGGRQVKAKVHVGDVTLDKALFKPDMCERFEMIVSGVVQTSVRHPIGC